jgi:hypothetical protein
MREIKFGNKAEKKGKDQVELRFRSWCPWYCCHLCFKAEASAATATQPGFTTSQVGTLLSTSGPGIVATGTKPAADATDTETDDTGDGCTWRSSCDLPPQ